MLLTELRFQIPMKHLTETPIMLLGTDFDPFSEATPYTSIAFFTDSSLKALQCFSAFVHRFSVEQRSKLTFTILLS